MSRMRPWPVTPRRARPPGGLCPAARLPPPGAGTRPRTAVCLPHQSLGTAGPCGRGRGQQAGLGCRRLACAASGKARRPWQRRWAGRGAPGGVGCARAPLPACGAESILRFLEARGTLPTDTRSSLLASRTPRLPLFVLPHAALILSKCGPRARPFLPSTSTTSPGLCPSGGPHSPPQDPGLCGLPLLQEAYRAEKWGRGERGPLPRSPGDLPHHGPLHRPALPGPSLALPCFCPLTSPVSPGPLPAHHRVPAMSSCSGASSGLLLVHSSKPPPAWSFLEDSGIRFPVYGEVAETARRAPLPPARIPRCLRSAPSGELSAPGLCWACPPLSLCLHIFLCNTGV